ncbi:hypothetical protein PHYBLDRAFT_143767 [Phycomyces blakesleeanus NRRL 1555(-)]|uniref:Uncharacterized protein n=1 Tax=Phycomyces blakesleeanus (strain ATCC 8743b / DSM 1359 / FGSC 10004 / NBRC 33097 / NRRL 1555) TaxID=763407 RepID=A0A162PYP1_PHYB8|nr:hypothetical protein PHYBLDRAFT_143767 [Phycomyces blakesleeanus NRRL 1555(-)]OAD75516.1 hypothetical protein PHYBLDRAFT_143767 [Phycomyces blakesleeanus NRRL 1555(-)]|eukprot:XP_018293556.1 hypothetical protein PHYBLDRAFT_143767 [Phycomyces blakesleeanus NRRL 1555(-)]
MHPLHNAISPKLLSTIKHGYEHDEPPSHEHIANQELSFHTSVIDMTILASPMYSLGLQINPFASGSACGKNPYTENANTSYYPAVLTFSYVRKLVLPPMMITALPNSSQALCPSYWVALLTILWHFDKLCNSDGDYTHETHFGTLWAGLS